MLVKKSGKKIFGATFTAAERHALDIEIKRQLAEDLQTASLDADSIFLWQLHEQCGWGKKRLKRFYMAYRPLYNKLIQAYEMNAVDGPWLCRQKLKDMGVDLVEWHNEL